VSALPRPDLPPGPHHDLVERLHELHHRAGWPSLSKIARATGVSHTTVSKAFSHPTLPTWGTLELLVEAMDGDTAAFRDLWLAATAPTDGGPAAGQRIAGRARELDVVRRHLEAGSGLLLVTGEAGIGKTRLVAAAAERSAPAVAVGHCLPLSTGVPLLPVIDVLRTLHARDDGRALRAAVDGCPPYMRASLATLLPEIALEAAGPARDVWGRERLFTTVATVLSRLSATERVAVVVEDCHWADPTTLDLLLHLSTRPSTVPIVCTWRSEDPDVPADHVAWLAQVRRGPEVTTLEVGPLGRAETAEQLRLVNGAEPDDALVDLVHTRSQGIPLYTAHLATRSTPDELPIQLADVLDRRLGDVEGAAWQVVRALGLAQRQLAPATLTEVTRLEDTDLHEALRALARRRLLTRGPTDEVGLSHPLFLEAVGRRLLPGEGAEVHARLAAALSTVPAIEPAEVADHWRAAGRPDSEASARVDAALAAGARFAFREELDTWLRVLELWDEGHSPDDVDLWEVLVAAIDSSIEAGDVDAGHALAERAAQLDLDELPVQSRAAVLHRLGSQRYEEGDTAGASALLDRSLELLEPLDPSPELLRLVEDRIGLLFQMGRQGDALAALDRSTELLGVADARFRQRSRALRVWQVFASTGDAEAAVDEVLRDLATEVDTDPVADLMVAANTTDLLLTTAAPARRAEEVARAPLAAAEAWDLQLSYPGALVRTNVCWAHLLAGDTRAARAWIEPITRSGPTHNTAFAHLMLAAIELREGDPVAAVERCRAADAQIRVHDQNWELCLPWVAEIDLWSGRADEVKALLTDVVTRGLAGESALAAAPMLVWLARANADALDASGAPPSVRRSTAHALQGLVAGAYADPFGPDAHDAATPARARLWVAELSRVARRATAEEWERAAVEWDGLPRPHDAAYCRWRAGQCALREGRGTVATRLLRRAAADARQHVPLYDSVTATAATAH
jgi:tetratricopeptide (TPR) repeat protein